MTAISPPACWMAPTSSPSPITLWIRQSSAAGNVEKSSFFLSVPPDSSLAFYPEIRLSDLDGLSVLLFSRIGFWMEMVKEKAPRAHFMLMVQRSSFTELVEHSAYPCFSSSYFINRGEMSARRVNIPIADEESRTSYYLSCLKENGKRFAPLFGQMREDAIS